MAMPNKTLEELTKEYMKLTDGVVREVENLDKKRAKIDGALARFDKVMAGVKGAAGLADDELMALGVEAGMVAVELAAVKVLATEGRVKRTLAQHKGWIEYALTKLTTGGPKMLSAVLDDVAKLSKADREAFDAQARQGTILAGVIAAHPELVGSRVSDLWRVYAKAVAEWLKSVNDKVSRWVAHPEDFDAKIKTLNGVVAQIAAILTAREKARQKKAPPAPRMIKTLIPRMMYFHR
jgi:hypothetical protein